MLPFTYYPSQSVSKSCSSYIRCYTTILFSFILSLFFHSFNHPSIHSFIHSLILFSFFPLALSEWRCTKEVRKYNEICNTKGVKRGNARNKCTKKTTVCFEVFTSCCAPWMISLVRVLIFVMTLFYQIHMPTRYKLVLYVRSDVTLVHLFQEPCALLCGL